MLGKAVKFRHCPATVIGKLYGPELVTAQAGRLIPDRASRKSGDRFPGNRLKHVSRGDVS